MAARVLPLFLLAPFASAQFFIDPELSEVLVQPLPGGHQVIEFVAGHQLVTAGHHLVLGSTTVAMPSVFVPQAGVVAIHLGVAGVDTSTDIHLPTAPAITIADSVAWFRTTPSANPGDLVDFVCWGGAVGPHVLTARLAGRWTTSLASAALPAAVGATLANRRITRSSTNMVGPDAWYEDTTPTLGSENDPATTWNFAVGCVDADPPNFGLLPGVEPGPWLGEPATLIVTNVVTAAVMVLSTTPTPPLHLDIVGMPFCFANVMIEATVLVPYALPYTTYTYTVPVKPLLAGFEFYLQAFVPENPPVNPMGARVTPALKALVGSR